MGTDASKYIRFDVLERRMGTKTDTVVVSNIMNGSQLGTIHWYSPFRKYVFAPEYDTVFDASCLDYIGGRLCHMMDTRKV